jgi:CRISPR-associated protein Cas5h
MNVVCFDYTAKYGHFLRAEANANGVTYPFPPRTALLGLIAAVLGLQKDALAVELAGANLALGGSVPRAFWHKTNVRKDPPAPLSWRAKATDKGSSSEQRNFRFPQEWLWRPCYRVWASLPGTLQESLARRLKDRRWHFTPCMGLSEMLADLEFIHESDAEPLPMDTHLIGSVVPKDSGEVDPAQASDAGLTLQMLRMPVAVTEDRVFSHRTYWLERHGRPFPFETARAWRLGQDIFSFL